MGTLLLGCGETNLQMGEGMTDTVTLYIICSLTAVVVSNLLRQVKSLESDIAILHSRQKELLGYIQENAEVVLRLGEYVQKLEKV